MGKATGFLEYKRADRPAAAPGRRILDFDDFHGKLSEAGRREQGARCMNCGVPFCQSEFGCPLHNLIPEWNDEIFSGNWAHALARLLKTNNFPEFTGRVCPALCETACTCRLNGEAVSVRDNELAVIEYAFANGLISPRIPPVRTGKRVAVVGSGPAGLAAADQLNQRGHAVTVYERDDAPGGLLMYGIPNMKLEKSVITRRIEMMEAEEIAFVTGADIGGAISGEELLAQYDAVVLCCGARKARDIEAENRDAAGVYQALEYLTQSTKAVLERGESAISAEGKHVVIIGNGDTATDCLATAIRQKAASVTQLVRRAAPTDDGKNPWPRRAAAAPPDYGHEEAVAAFGRDPRLYETTAKKLLTDGGGRLTGVLARQGTEELTLPADLLLIAAGFSGAEEGSAAAFGLALDENGRLGAGPGPYHTAVPQVFAAGDMRRGASLVATAIAEGRACAKEVDKYLEGYTNL